VAARAQGLPAGAAGYAARARARAWYSSRPEYIKRFVDRGSLYLHHIVEEVEKRGMPTEIALLPVIESAFNPHAYSRSKASGLWQFIPPRARTTASPRTTGRTIGATSWRHPRRAQLPAAPIRHVRELGTGLAAYNCGEGCVGRAIAANQRKGLPTDYLSLKLPPETVNYVPKLVAVKNIVLARPCTASISSRSRTSLLHHGRGAEKIDVKLAAKLAGMPEDEFVALNPSHNKPVAVGHTGTWSCAGQGGCLRENLGNWTSRSSRGTRSRARRASPSMPSPALRACRCVAEAGEQPAGEQEGRLTVSQPILVPDAGKEMCRWPPRPPGRRRSGGARAGTGLRCAGGPGPLDELLHGEGRRHALWHRRQFGKAVPTCCTSTT